MYLRVGDEEILFITNDEFSNFLGRLADPLVFFTLYDALWLSVANLSTIDSNSPNTCTKTIITCLVLPISFLLQSQKLYRQNKKTIKNYIYRNPNNKIIKERKKNMNNWVLIYTLTFDVSEWKTCSALNRDWRFVTKNSILESYRAGSSSWSSEFRISYVLLASSSCSLPLLILVSSRFFAMLVCNVWKLCLCES